MVLFQASVESLSFGEPSASQPIEPSPPSLASRSSAATHSSPPPAPADRPPAARPPAAEKEPVKSPAADTKPAVEDDKVREVTLRLLYFIAMGESQVFLCEEDGALFEGEKVLLGLPATRIFNRKVAWE